MAKYHINRESGELGVCKANKRACPVGDAQDHFESEAEGIAELERRFEQRYADALLGTAKSKVNLDPQNPSFRDSWIAPNLYTSPKGYSKDTLQIDLGGVPTEDAAQLVLEIREDLLTDVMDVREKVFSRIDAKVDALYDRDKKPYSYAFSGERDRWTLIPSDKDQDPKEIDKILSKSLQKNDVVQVLYSSHPDHVYEHSFATGVVRAFEGNGLVLESSNGESITIPRERVINANPVSKNAAPDLTITIGLEPVDTETEVEIAVGKRPRPYVAQATHEIPGVVERTVERGEIGVVSTPFGTGKIDEILRSAKDRGISTSIARPRDMEAWNFDNFKPADLLILDEFTSEDDARAFASSLDRTQYKSIIINQSSL